jgi:hypothetical protein
MAGARGRACREANAMLTSFDHRNLPNWSHSLNLVNQTVICPEIMKHTCPRIQSRQRAHHVQPAIQSTCPSVHRCADPISFRTTSIESSTTSIIVGSIMETPFPTGPDSPASWRSRYSIVKDIPIALGKAPGIRALDNKDAILHVEKYTGEE